MTGTPDITHGTLEDIDKALETWMTTVKTTADRHIPKTSYRLSTRLQTLKDDSTT